MSGRNIFNGQKFPAYLCCVCCALLIILTAGCGDESSKHATADNDITDSSGTGSVAFSIQWHPDSNYLDSAAALARQQAIVDCSAIGVETITCDVYDESNNPIASGGPWDCDGPNPEGEIKRIPAGTNRTFVVLGWDTTTEGDIVYRGQITGITITPGETRYVGTIDSYPFVPSNLSATGVSVSQINLSWTISSAISDAIAVYRIYNSIDGSPVGKSNTPSFIHDGLSQSTQYCYTVSSYDVFNNESGQTNAVCASTTDNQAPSANITAPSNGTTVNLGDSITFSGTGEDAEDGILTGNSLVWTSSINGQIGTGTSFNNANLSAGTHTITLTATDSAGATGSDSITILITIPNSIVFLNFYNDTNNTEWYGLSQLAGYLQEMGFSVFQQNVGTIEASDLAAYTIVVFGGEPERVISTTEASTIRNFVENGGRLLLAGNHYFWWSQDQTVHYSRNLRNSVNRVGNAWGISFDANMVCDPSDFYDYQGDPDGGVDSPYIYPIADHAAVSNVPYFILNWGCSLTVSSPARAIAAVDGDEIDIPYYADAWLDLNPASTDENYDCTYDPETEDQGIFDVMAVVEPGQGRVVAIGDPDMWFNYYFNNGIPGTPELATSVFSYLGGQ